MTVLTSLVNPTPAAVEGTLVGEEIRAADTVPGSLPGEGPPRRRRTEAGGFLLLARP